MPYLMNCHRNPKGKIVAACDPELVGKTFSEGDLSMTVDEQFYGGDEVDLDQILEELVGAKTGNFVGEQLITALIEEGLVQEEQVKRIDGIPHSQVYYL